jgi:hypothetical protein
MRADKRATVIPDSMQTLNRKPSFNEKNLYEWVLKTYIKKGKSHLPLKVEIEFIDSNIAKV